METLEACRICRLCGKHSEISIDLFDKKEAIINKIHAVLPISIHEMDMLPKQMCHRCSYKLEEFHKFYIQCIKTDENLKSQLSWMRKDKTDKIIVPMVHIGNFKIKTEPIDVDSLEETVLKPSTPFLNRFSMVKNGFSPFSSDSYCRCYYHREDCTKQRLLTSPGDMLIQPTQVLVPSIPHNSRLPSVQNITSDKSSDKIQLSVPVIVDIPENDSEKRPPLSELVSVKENILKQLQNPFSKSTVIGDISKSRTLRPRRNSVDYVLNKKKNTDTPRTQSETSRVPLEPCIQLDMSRTQTKITPVKIKEESGLRVLRPRKTDVNYQSVTKRKQTTNLKQSKKYKYNSSLIKVENGTVEYSESSSEDKSKENQQNKEDKIHIDFSKITIKIEDEGTKNINKTWHKESNYKTKNEKQCSSIRLRSQDVRLRSGKVKLPNNEINKIKIFKDKSDKSMSKNRIRNIVRRNDIKIKQFCEKCNISYINKRHKCASD